MKKLSTIDVMIYMFCTLLAIILVMPFYSVVIRSFATPAAVAGQKFYLIPTVFDTTAYEAIIRGGNFIRAFSVSVFVTILGTVLSMLLTVCGAYVLTKKELPGKNLIMILIIITMFFNGGLVPYYLNIKDFGMINSVFVMIVPTALNTFYMIIMMNYIRSIPDSLEESAKIDGASYLTVLFRVILPVSKPTMAAITLFYAVDKWNEWWNALLFISDKDKYPMQLFLRELLVDVTVMSSNSMAASMISSLKKVEPDGVKMAGVIVTIIPIMMVYPFLQRHFSAGVMVGSIKG